MEAMNFFSQHSTRLPTLDADAWRSLLDCLETRDVVRLGAVCKEWRDAVHTYLQGVHGFAILRESNMADAKYRLVQLSDHDLVQAMFRNLGRHMARVTTDGGRDWIQAIAENCPRLREITLHNVPEDSNEELLNLWRCCRALERVSFRSSKWVRELSSPEATLAHVAPMCHQYPGSLRTLAAPRAMYAPCRSSQVDDGFTFYLKHLKHIEIERNERVTGAFLNMVNRQLESMSLKDCSELQPGQFQRNVDKLANITKLELDESPSVFEEVHQLLGAMPQLKELSLSHYRGNYDQSRIKELAVAISRLRLRILRLRRNGAVDDGFLEIVARGCGNLETLELPGCNGNYYHAGVTDAGIAAVAHSCRLLQFLDLSSLGSLTSQGLRVLGSCQDLASLALRRNEGIKERAFFLLVKSCPNLRTLDVRGCAAATGRLVQEIAKIVPARRHALALLLAATSVQQQDITELMPQLAGRLTATLDGSEQEPWERHYTTMLDAGVYENYPHIPEWHGNGGNHWGVMEVDNNY